MRWRQHPQRSGSRGFTLVELMVVVAIVAVLATLAVPALRGNTEDRFRRDFNQLYQELMQAKALSLSKREQFSLIVTGSNHYQVKGVWHGDPALTWIEPPVRDVTLSNSTKITNVRLCADIGMPTSCTGTVDAGIPAFIRFIGSEVVACVTNCDQVANWKPTSATIYIQGYRPNGSVDPTLQKRIVVFQSTGYIKQYK